MKIYYLIFILFTISCSKEDAGISKQVEVEKSHSHVGLYGGVLHELEGHKASLEILIDEGHLKLFIHDGCAEKSIRIQQEKIAVLLKSVDGEKNIFLRPVVSELSGDKVGAASCFQNSESGVKFEAVDLLVVKSIEIQGIVYENVESKVKK